MTDKHVHRVDAEPKPAPTTWFNGRVEMEAIHHNPDKDIRQGRHMGHR